jgi:hypothetical protein
MARTLAVLKGSSPAEAIARYPGATTVSASSHAPVPQGSSAPPSRPVGGASAGTTYYKPSPESSTASGLLLNYLLGN